MLRIFKSKKKINTPTMLDRMEVIQYPVVMVPFHGTMTPVKLRMLSSAQLQSCGDFSLIETYRDKLNRIDKKYTQKEVTQYAETMHKLAELALVEPTYKQLMEMASATELIKNYTIILNECNEQLKSMPFGNKRSELEEQIAGLRIRVDLLLPEDFLSFICCYVMGIDKSDIKKVTEEMLLNAACLAEKWNKSPSDYITGAFTDYMKLDIDKRAFLILYDKREEQKKGKVS